MSEDRRHADRRHEGSDRRVVREDRRHNLAGRAALDRLESYHRLHPDGGLSWEDAWEGVRLTLTQQIVAALYADGCTEAEIAEHLGCTLATAGNHIDQLDARLVEAKVPGEKRKARIRGWVRRRQRAAGREALEPTGD